MTFDHFCYLCVRSCFRVTLIYPSFSQMNTQTEIERESDRGAWNETCRCCIVSWTAGSQPTSKPRKVSSNKCISDQTTHCGSCICDAWYYSWQDIRTARLWLAVELWENNGWPCGKSSLSARIDFGKIANVHSLKKLLHHYIIR